MTKQKKRNIIIGVLCSVLLLMAVSYAAFSTVLNIEGTTNITSNWDIKITGITSKDIIGSAYDIEDPTHTELEATFKTGLISPGDSITYDISVENQGNLDAYLQTITINKKDNPAIIFESSGLEENGKLSPGDLKILTIKVTFNEEITEMPENKEAGFNVQLDFNQKQPIIDATPVVTYKCPSGYSQSGSGPTMTCSRTVDGTVTTTCSNGCTVSGKSCTGTQFKDPLSNGCSGIRMMQCKYSPYTSYQAVACYGNYANFYEATITCPSGYVATECGRFGADGYRSGGTAYAARICIKSCSSSDASYSCQSGYTKSGYGTSTRCIKTETTTRQEITTYTCPDGYTLKETNKCYKE